MDIEIKDALVLSDGNEYAVSSKVNYQDNNYLYLVDINNNENIKFCLEKRHNDQISVLEIEDEDLIRTLMPLLYNEVKEIIE